MKVKCIDNCIARDSLSLNKVYDIVLKDAKDYRIKDDNGELLWYSKNRFEIVEEKNNKIDDQYNDDTSSTNEYIHPTLDMIKILLNNPTYRAEHSFEPNCSIIICISSYGDLIYENDRKPYILNCEDIRKWKIIKPVIKVKFAEAFKIFKNNYTDTNIKSLLTNNEWCYVDDLLNQVTDEEIDGLWTIEHIGGIS